MGENIIYLYKTKCKKEYKTAFLSAIILGLFVHIYKLTNYLPNHDTVYNFYSNQNVLSSGRWLLSFACGFSSYFDLPWINGIFALLYIALTSVVIVSLFEVKNTVPIILISGLLVSFPAVTETMFFEFTADGYMLAMLLSALAVYLIRLKNNKIQNVLFSAVLLCMSCGIYQAYVSFAIVLMIFYFIARLLEDDADSLITYLRWIVHQLISVILGLAMYFALWKICLSLQNAEMTGYQGIDSMGLSFGTIIGGFKNTIIAILRFLLEGNIKKYSINLYCVLNILMIISFGAIIIYSIIKNKQRMNKFKVMAVAFCVLCVPFAVCIWFFTSDKVEYSPRMLQSIVLVFVFSIVLCDKYVKLKAANIFALLISVVIINFSIMANIAYFYLNIECENSMIDAIYMKGEIQKAINKIDSDYELAIVGSRLSNVELDPNSEAQKARLFTSMMKKSFLYDSEHIIEYFNKIMYYYPKTALQEKCDEISKSAEFKKMDSWDESNEVYIVNNKYIVMKLS